MRHFWNWVKNDDETRTLYLEGVIAEESWFSDDITPAMFKEELFSGNGPITDVTVQIDGMAASAASVIAMAGTRVCMSPTSMMMIHNPFTMAMGDTEEMRKAIQLLDEVKESIINAYQIKTGLSRDELSKLMDGETWMNALKAKELGFCDEVLYTGDLDLPDNVPGFSFGRRAAAACLMNRVIATLPKPEPAHPPDPEPTSEPVTPDNRVKAADLMKRLSLLK